LGWRLELLGFGGHTIYANKVVWVTGGLGFIGSNLAIRLVELGARVTLIDSLVEGCGGTLDNVLPVLQSLEIRCADLKDTASFATELEAPEVIFNLAGEVSHAHSMAAPVRDLQLNTIAQLNFLTTCADRYPGVRIVYASTRQVYGAPRHLPVTEDHPIDPVDFNGVHKFAACSYHMVLSRLGKIDAIVLRLTNVYGPRMALNVPGKGFLHVYLRNALAKRPIEVYGDGKQLRDPVHVDDVVDAFLLVGMASGTSRVFNLGGPEALQLGQIAEIAAHAGGCKMVQREFPEYEKAIDIGSYCADASRLARELNWCPRIHFRQGFVETVEAFKGKAVVQPVGMAAAMGAH
jgi:UDP-glucose 4-epimerase